MNTGRIRMGHRPDEPTPPNVFSDFEWASRHETELLEKYGECMILVYQEQVLGKGDTYEEVLEDAERNLPPDIEEATPILTFLHYRIPFVHVRSGSVHNPRREDG